MIFSFQELKKIANLDKKITIDELVNAVNSIGFEVENISSFAPIKNVKFGEIIEVYKNPNADKLNVCKVKFVDKKRTIQTNAENVHKGMIVVAFLPGAKINNFTIETKKIRGIISEGMLSNLSEFGIDNDLLRTDAKTDIYNYKKISINEDVVKKLGLDDKLIDIKILSNRSDANSYYVMAMEIAAYFGKSVNLPTLKKGGQPITRKIDINKANVINFIEAKNDFNINIKDQLFLAKHNIKSINNAVDLSNLTLLYTGLPIHIYDLSKVGKKISVDFSSDNVDIIGNKTVKLDHNLIIRDENKVISIASVIGLENTKVENTTKNILIEFGIFSHLEIKKSLKLLKLETKAASQGIKKISPGTLQFALIYISNQLNSFSEVINLKIFNPKVIRFDKTALSQIAGIKMKNNALFEKAKKALINLGFIFESKKIIAPLYRNDITDQQDLNEEILRFYGYDNIPSLPYFMNAIKIKSQNSIKEKLQAQGYNETRTYTLVSNHKNKINPFKFQKTIKLKTYVSNNYTEIRNSQAVSLLEIADYNIKYGLKNISIFSDGMINNGIETIALLSNVKNFYQIKTDILNLIPQAKFTRMITDQLHPNIASKIIVDQKLIGWLGKVHPQNSKNNYIMAEFFKSNYYNKIIFKDYDKRPLKYEDINIIIKKNEDIDQHLKSYQNKFRIELIDQYEIKDKIKVTIRVYKNK